MTRRRLLLALGLALALLIALTAVPPLMPPRPGATEANCARIKAGMSGEEVQAILGGPPQHNLITRLGYHTEAWVADEGAASVEFGPDGAAVRAQFFYATRPTLLQRLRRRLIP